MYAAVDAAEIVYPTDLLNPADCPKRIDLGGVVAVIDSHRVTHRTDLIIRIPQRDIAFVGDLLFHRSYPVTIDAEIIAWRRVLARFAREQHDAPGAGDGRSAASTPCATRPT